MNWLKKHKKPIAVLTLVALIGILGIAIGYQIGLIDGKAYTQLRKEEAAKVIDSSRANSTKIGVREPGSEVAMATSSPPRPHGAGDYSISKKCTDTIIPYETISTDSYGMYQGEVMVSNKGLNGVRKECTSTYDGKDWGAFKGKQEKLSYIEVQQQPSYVTRGTRQRAAPEAPAASRYSHEQAMQNATTQCQGIAVASGTSSSSYQVCLSSWMRQYGY